MNRLCCILCLLSVSLLAGCGRRETRVEYGNREQVLDAYRQVRDGLVRRIRDRFGTLAARGV